MPGGSAVRGTIQEATPMEPIVMRDVVPRSEVPKMHWKTLRLGKLQVGRGRGEDYGASGVEARRGGDGFESGAAETSLKRNKYLIRRIT